MGGKKFKMNVYFRISIVDNRQSLERLQENRNSVEDNICERKR